MSPSTETPPIATPLLERPVPEVSLNWWQQLLVAFSCATLLYGGQIRVIAEPRNRMHEFWTLETGLSYVTGITLLGVVIYLFRNLTSRSRWATLADHFLWLAVILSLPCLFFGHVPAAPSLFLIPFVPAMIVLVISFLQPSARIIAKLEKGALLLSPLFFVLAFQLLTYRTWGGSPEVPAHQFPTRKANPIFIFVFDEWSYKRSVQDEAFLPSLTNLCALARQSCFFEKAESPGSDTWPSLDRFIYQTSDELVFLGETPHWRQKNGEVTSTTKRESLFGLAGAHNYNSALIGFYIPQRQILGNQVGYVDSHSMWSEPRTFPEKVWRKFRRSLANTVNWWVDGKAVSAALIKDEARRVMGIEPRRKSSPRLLQEKVVSYLSTRLNEETSIHGRDLVQHVEKETLAMIGSLPANSILLSHIQIPHSPFIFDEKGTYLGPFQGMFKPLDLDGYLRQVGYLDTIIGRYIDAMIGSGKFDEAMIVVTSDHSYRFDPKEDDLRHVPLLVKLPYQKEAVQIRESFSLKSMKPVFNAVMAGRLDEARAALMDAGD